MKISFHWLKRYVDLSVEPEALLEVFPKIGFEVDSIERTGLPQLESIVVGEVLSRDKHPDADKLSVCTVTVGVGDPLNIVCGAPNCDVGNRVIVAQVGARMPEGFKIKRSKLRGVPSEGMLCSARELGLGQDHEGIFILDKKHSLGTPINEVFPDGDVIFDLEITANRGDCLSHIGIARELAAYYNTKLKAPESAVKVSAEAVNLLKDLEVTAPDCSYYTAWSLQGITQGESPDWMQKDLEAVGLRPVNLIVDVVNWVMFETGQPMHAFDAKKIRGTKLLVRKAKSGESIITLDEKKHTLNEDVLIIADAERPLVVAGVMGSLDAEVDGSTTDIILESAYFDPASIRKTARMLNLSTDSSYRFERDVDPACVYSAAERAIGLIQELGGATCSLLPTTFGKAPLNPVSIAITGDYVRDLLGFAVEDAIIEDVWTRLGFSVEHCEGSSWRVVVPSYRREVFRPVDLVEEFVRLFGTDNIEEAPVRLSAVHRPDDPVVAFNRELANYFVAQGANECCHYSMRSGEEVKALFSESSEKELRLHNPLASDQGHLRPSLIPSLLDALRYNIHHGNSVRKLFELGHVFLPQGKNVEERVACAFVFLAEPLERRWKQSPSLDFYSAKNTLENMVHYAGVDPKRLPWEAVSGEALWQDGHAALVNHPKYTLRAGLLNLSLLKERWGLRQLVYAGELSLHPQVLAKAGKLSMFEAFSAFPPVTRDIALLVDQDCSAASVKKDIARIAEAASKNVFSVESINIFDVYTGVGLPEGKKSLAFELTFRSSECTLKDAEVSAVFDIIQKETAALGCYTVRDSA